MGLFVHYKDTGDPHRPDPIVSGSAALGKPLHLHKACLHEIITII